MARVPPAGLRFSPEDFCEAWSAYKKGDPEATAAWSQALDRSVAFVHISDFAREKLQCFGLPEKELKEILEALMRRLANEVSRGVRRRSIRRKASPETKYEKAFRLMLSSPSKGHRRAGSSKYDVALAAIPEMEAAVTLYRTERDAREIHRIEQDLALGMVVESDTNFLSSLDGRAPRGAAYAIIARAQPTLKELSLRRYDEMQRAKRSAKSMRKKPL